MVIIRNTMEGNIMSKVDIFNIEESIQEHIHEGNEKDLRNIADHFKKGQFETVIENIHAFQAQYEVNESLKKLFTMLQATSLIQMDEHTKAKELLNDLYEASKNTSIEELHLYGDIAFMCDYKLARKIMANVTQQMEETNYSDPLAITRAFLTLGEAEENLQKYKRAIKYYKKGLDYLMESPNKQHQMVIFLHYKLGGLHSMTNQIDEAIRYLQLTLEQTMQDHSEIEINTLVSLAKMYGQKKQYDKANQLLEQALPLLAHSSLKNKLVHAEAYTELAYNHFDLSQFEEAIPYYNQAIDTHKQLSNYSSRELGMIYMQYAHCLIQVETYNQKQISKIYGLALEELEKTEDYDLIESALADIIAFHEKIGNSKKKHYYEDLFVKLINKRKMDSVSKG